MSTKVRFAEYNVATKIMMVGRSKWWGQGLIGVNQVAPAAHISLYCWPGWAFFNKFENRLIDTWNTMSKWKLYLIHINGLECFSPGENYGMILIFRFSLSNICGFSRKLDAVNFLNQVYNKKHVTELKMHTQKAKDGALLLYISFWLPTVNQFVQSDVNYYNKCDPPPDFK